MVVHVPDIYLHRFPDQRSWTGHRNGYWIPVHRRHRPVDLRHDYAVDRYGIGADLFHGRCTPRHLGRL